MEVVYIVPRVQETVMLVNASRVQKRINVSLRLENNLPRQTSRQSVNTVHIGRAESLNIERRYSCCAMLNFEPVTPPASEGISQINKTSLVVHM